MSEVIKNIKQLVDNYIDSNHSELNVPGSFMECFYFNVNNGSTNFKNIIENINRNCQYFLLKVLRETPYDTIKEKLGDDALVWLYNLEKIRYNINFSSKDSVVFWFSPEKISIAEVYKKKLEGLESELKKI